MFQLIPSQGNALRNGSFDRLFADFDRWFEREPLAVAGSAFNPRVDIRETEGELELKAELPGVSKEAVQVEVHRDVLTISGEKKADADEDRNGYHRRERVYGAFKRSFRLPETVDGEQVEAVFKDGVLTVKLPKRPEAKPRQIEIHN